MQPALPGTYASLGMALASHLEVHRQLSLEQQRRGAALLIRPHLQEHLEMPHDLLRS